MTASLTHTAAPFSNAAPIEASFEQIYRRHFAGVWRLLRRLGVATAQLDDAAQDVFVVVYRKFARWDRRTPPRPWIYAIAVRVASDYRRNAHRKPSEPLPDTLRDLAPDPSRESELRQSVQLLHELLATLDDERRQVFVLSELEQLSAPEIAAVLNLNLNTVYSRQRAARSSFEAALERHQARSTHQTLSRKVNGL